MGSTDTGCSDMYDSYKSRSSDSSLNYSSDINAISVDLPHRNNGRDEGDNDDDDDNISCSGLKYLPTWPAVNLEFHDLTYEVPDADGKGRKRLLHSINGQFRSGELTAIMGPSGAGKTTLLNLLAGYGAKKSSGKIMVNHSPRDMKVFRKMSRYIMQNDILDPHFTVLEAMTLAANLKLGNELTRAQKREVIDEILSMLGLFKVQNTTALRLSGGEKKRLCIALELVNNPPILFLDEPTTGLDELSSTHCISLLRGIAHRTGRTVVCSIHTPSAKIFDMFDKIYVLAEGECVYQGTGANIVPYLRQIGLDCPLTYNPADFVIEVAAREYGNEYHQLMVDAIENGKIYRYIPNQLRSSSSNKSDTTSGASSYDELEKFDSKFEEINPQLLKSKCTWFMQYRLLLTRMLQQMWRDKSYIKLKFYMNLALGFIVGGIYQGVGKNATMALFNFGFAVTINIAYLYLPMMPILLQFPTEMKFLKREYFNQWYRLSSYYAALICAKLPYMFFLAVIYLSMVYMLSSQPLELFRFCLLFVVAFLVAMTSESLGLLISSRLSLVNAMFMGPVVAVPLILLSCYGAGYGKNVYIHPLVRHLMSLSYLRHGMEGLIAALYGFNRKDAYCPENEVFCMFRKSDYLLITLGFDNLNYLYSVGCLIVFYLVFTVAAYLMIKQRLSLSHRNNAIFQFVSRFMVKYLNFTSYNY